VSAARQFSIASARLAAQQITGSRCTTPLDVVRQLGAVQAQDYNGALWSIGLRLPGATRGDVERAIAERHIIRTWPMRGTLHFVPAADAKWMLALMARRVIKRAAGRHKQLELDAATFKRSRALITKALERTPVLTRAEIFAVLEKGRVSTAGQRGIHILQQHCMEAHLCYGPHSASQPTFTLFDEWISSSRELSTEEALKLVAERYFAGHGPATLRDFVWWTGLTVREAKDALRMAAPNLASMTHGDVEYWMSPELEVPNDAPRAHLLPGFDEYLLGYKDRSAVLPAAHKERIVPGGNGMFLSTIVVDGIVRGTWRRTARAKSVEVELMPFAKLPARARKELDVPLRRYSDFLAIDVRAH
jgi:hypothetical protein